MAIIRIGGATQVGMKERKDRVEDAMHAIRAAVEEGMGRVVGSALIYASKALEKLESKNEDQKVGIEIVRRALKVLTRPIAENAGMDGSIVIAKLTDQKNSTWGFDVQAGEYKELVKAGIVDPTKVVRSALQHAASAGGMGDMDF